MRAHCQFVRGGVGVAPVFGLFLLAPFVGEFLLGNITIAALPLGILLAPLYGCGAILVRESGRRSGGGWPTMLLLAAAYALIEEGPVDQLLWNSAYAGQDQVHTASYVPVLGTSVALIQSVLALHTVWSIAVPIALVETLTPARRTTPWLGRTGLIAVAVGYVAGAVFVWYGNYTEEHFVAPPLRLVQVGVVIAGLVVAAFAIRAHRLLRLAGKAPGPGVVGAASLVATSAYWGPSVLATAAWYEWVGVIVWLLVAGGGAIVVSRWSRREGWDQRHRFALAAGAVLTYVWAAFPLRPEQPGDPTVDLIGNAVFGAVGIVLLVSAARAARRDDELGCRRRGQVR
ncbi:DUF998 domain-containing protein [Nocardia terpenica]|nr:DUF998 domain-containing protein [Nocardia terpenica]MBF6102662.1 DUF998 domain-containing protein [Nocardia terpenica]MBF6111147.1 DUF998 domain-containing protein [Nocardia terpenica]MBF6117278.1 DUF998 domain-containing protein [Nocardia terpenica]MBF6150881.1 DUF998 domain-containing protein [Nocardia terpenica]